MAGALAQPAPAISPAFVGFSGVWHHRLGVVVDPRSASSFRQGALLHSSREVGSNLPGRMLCLMIAVTC